MFVVSELLHTHTHARARARAETHILKYICARMTAHNRTYTGSIENCLQNLTAGSSQQKKDKSPYEIDDRKSFVFVLLSLK